MVNGGGGDDGLKEAGFGGSIKAGGAEGSSSWTGALFSFLYLKKTKFQKYMMNREILKNG